MVWGQFLPESLFVFHVSLCCPSLSQRRLGGGNTGLGVWSHSLGWRPAHGWFRETLECAEGEASDLENRRGWPSDLSAAFSGPSQDEGLERWLSERLGTPTLKREPGFRPQCPRGGSRLVVTPFQGSSALFRSLRAPGVHMVHTHAGKTPILIK